MATVVENRVAGMSEQEGANRIRKNWGWFLAFGLVQIGAGVLAISFTFSATLASVVVLGTLFLVAAGAQLVVAVSALGRRGSLLFLLLSVLYGIAGLLTLRHPLLAAEGLTLMLAAAFLVGGAFRIVAALVERFPGWGWVLTNGIVTFLMGLLIWEQWPESGLWVLGMFVGIDLVINGMTWAMLAVDVRYSTPPGNGRVVQ
jgi:uncharacterized membrane protein HdeD (DUF308 family)